MAILGELVAQMALQGRGISRRARASLDVTPCVGNTFSSYREGNGVALAACARGDRASAWARRAQANVRKSCGDRFKAAKVQLYTQRSVSGAEMPQQGGVARECSIIQGLSVVSEGRIIRGPPGKLHLRTWPGARGDAMHCNLPALRLGLAFTTALLLAAACTAAEDTLRQGSTAAEDTPREGGTAREPDSLKRMWNAMDPLPSRTFVLDGQLTEWSDADRLDSKPGMAVADHALFGYHDALKGKYRVAISSSAAMGPGTTFWLNTDGDMATGYQVWGSEVGAEFNINIAADGAPHLYSGADGEVWRTGPISHAFNADKTILEFEFTHAMVSATTPVAMWVDINNATFMPGWYGIGGYVIDAEGIPAPPSAPDGEITLDGDLKDWSPTDRLDRKPGTGVLGYELYGRADASNYYLAMRALPPAVGLGPGTTLWLNTDRDRSTGYQVWGIAVGAEHNINFAHDGTPHLYTGAAAQNWQIGPLPFAKSADGNVIEIAVARDMLDPLAVSIDVSVDVNDALFMPADFTSAGYTLFHPKDLPARSDDHQVRVAMVFSATSAGNYFNDKAYSQLYAAMQHQAMQAGIPFVMIHEESLMDINNIKDFNAIFLPYMSHVSPAALQAIDDTLTKAIYHYGIGIVTAGNFLTNAPDGSSLPGDSYVRMKRLLGLTLEGWLGPVDFSIVAGSGHRILDGYAQDEALANYTGGHAQYYGRYDSVAQSLASFVTAQGAHDAAWAVSTGARSVHFASPAVMGDTDLAWRALLWVVYGESPWVGLQLSRGSALFVSRCDMDQSQHADEAAVVYGGLLPIVTKWHEEFSFVSTYFVNVGNNKAEYEYTDWSVSGPIYKKLMGLGGEIGTHSYTHPHNTSLLSPAELEFEFKTSRDVIAANLGVPVVGAAVPGNPEPLAVDNALDGYFSYVTADYSGFLAGYHGAAGFLTPDFSMVYLAPNMYFDFTMIDFWNISADAALGMWKVQYDALVAHAPAAVVVWPWHDYGPGSYESAKYTEAMFGDLIAHAWSRGAEFVTAALAAERIKGFVNSEITVTPMDADTVKVEVLGNSATGGQSLRFEPGPGRHIASVDGWPAFAGNRVLLSEGDRVYVVRFSSAPIATPRISKLPMRASLKTIIVTESSAAFSFHGVGVVEVAVPPGLPLPAVEPVVDCGAVTTFDNGVLKLNFASEGLHTCKVDYAPDAGAMTCQGKCGGQGSGGCWCDAKCLANNDCCPDFANHCGGGSQCGGGVSSCGGKCGGKAASGCWCDSQCAKYGDCCKDINYCCG